jgi:hypothetical protein
MIFRAGSYPLRQSLLRQGDSTASTSAASQPAAIKQLFINLLCVLNYYPRLYPLLLKNNEAANEAKQR